jgi:hypothetical protein
MKKRAFFVLIIVMIMSVVLVFSGCNKREEIKVPAVVEAPDTKNIIQTDLLVYGSEPEGIAAAVAGGRGDLQVLLVDPREELGGLFTLGALNFLDMNHGKDRTLLTRGIFEEFYNRVGGTAFDLERAKEVFGDMLGQEETVSTALGYSLEEVLVKDGVLQGVIIKETASGNELQVNAKQFIDASADADLAAMAGVPYTLAGEDIGEKERQMGVTLVFTLGNVDWKEVTAYLKSGKEPNTGVTSKAAWGYTELGYAYEPVDPLMRLRGFNAARQENGEVLINALVIFGVDVLDPESKKQGIERGKKELEHILPYVRANFPGFEKAELIRTADELYVRESRHILAEYLLTIDDVLEYNDQWDKVALASYPVDVQPTIAQRWGTIIGNPDRYAIPFRSLVPLEIDNLMVAGKASGYTSLAAGSARVVPIGMAAAEGAGVAAKIAIENNITPRELSKNEVLIKNLQEELKRRGAYLEDINVPKPEAMSHWAYPGVKVVRSLGLLDGGYENNYRLEEKMSKWRFQNLVNKVILKAGVEYPVIEVNDPPSNEEFIINIAKVVDKNVKEYEDGVTILKEKGIMTEILEPYFQDKNAQGNAAEVTWLAANLYTFLTSN